MKLDFGLGASSISAEARKAWPYEFALVYSVTLGTQGLQTMLNVRNEGGEAFEFQMLLHTYLRIQVRSIPKSAVQLIDQDISTTTVAGLLGVNYVDKVLDKREHQESQAAIRISGEIDRVYTSIPQDTTSILEGGKARFDVVRDNLADTVVWNPWIQKAKGMGDFEPKHGMPLEE